MDFPKPPPPPELLRRPVLCADEGAEAGLARAAVVKSEELGFRAAPLPTVAGVSLEDDGVPLADDFAVDARDWILDFDETLAIANLPEVFAGADDAVLGFTAR